MAIDTSFTNKYRYFGQTWGQIDERFIRNVLLPGLNKQGCYSSAAGGILLDDESPAQYLSLEEASRLVLDWLFNIKSLDQESVNELLALAKPGSYTHFVKLINTKFNNLKEQERIAVATNEDRLESYRQHLAQSGKPAGSYRFSSAETIKNYHRQREEIITLLRRGYSTSYIKTLSIDDNSPIARALYSTLADNLSRLYGASYQFGKEEEVRSQAISKELFQIIQEEHPELTDLLPVLRDPTWSRILTRQIDQVVQTTTPQTLRQLEIDRHTAIQAQADLLPTRSELHQEIVSVLSRGGISRPNDLANAILTEIVASHGNQISTGEVVRLATQHLGEAKPEYLARAVSLLRVQGLDIAIEYRQREMHILYQGVRLSGVEKRLLSQGISFLHSSADQSTIEAVILQELGIQSSPNLHQSLEEAYQQEQSTPTPSPRLNKLRTLREHYWHSSHLDKEQIKLLAKTRFGRLDTLTKINVLSEKIYDFYDTATGGKIIRRFYDWYDKTAETKAILKLKIRGKEVKIPLLRLSSWAFDQWDLLKKRTTLRLYRLASSSKLPSWARRPTRWFLRQYRLGDYTINGTIFQFAHRQIGKATAWALAKTGLSSIFKYAAKPSAGLAVRYTANVAARAAVRLFIKIGGKALGKLAVKGVTALLAAGTVIGSIFSAVAIIGIVFDLLKVGFQFVREFIRNVDFRKQVLKIGAVLAGIGAAFAALPLGAMLAIIIGSLVSLALLAFVISGGFLVGTALIYHLSIQTIPGLDVKYEPPASSANFGTSISCTAQGAIPAPASSGIPTRASEIIADLHTGFWNYCNRPTNPEKSLEYLGTADVPVFPAFYTLSNRPNLFDYDLFKSSPDPSREEIQTSGNALYWCTYLVQHSYRESGKSGFSTSLWSPTLEDEFRQDHTFVEGSVASGSNVKPGDIVFFKVEGGPDRTNHVGIVNNVDAGGFSYYQSNAPAINGSGTFNGGANAEPGVNVVGFGRL